MAIMKIEGVKVPYLHGELTGLREGSEVNWYWNPANYGEMYHLFGHMSECPLKDELASFVDNGAFDSYINAVIEEKMDLGSEDSSLFSEIYIRIHGEQ